MENRAAAHRHWDPSKQVRKSSAVADQVSIYRHLSGELHKVLNPDPGYAWYCFVCAYHNNLSLSRFSVSRSRYLNTTVSRRDLAGQFLACLGEYRASSSDRQAWVSPMRRQRYFLGKKEFLPQVSIHIETALTSHQVFLHRTRKGPRPCGATASQHIPYPGISTAGVLQIDEVCGLLHRDETIAPATSQPSQRPAC